MQLTAAQGSRGRERALGLHMAEDGEKLADCDWMKPDGEKNVGL